jgi:hypothetical protein
VVRTPFDLTNVLDLSRSNPLECREHFGYNRKEVCHAIGPSTNNHNPKRKNGQILLVLELAIHRHENIRDAARALQQSAVLGSRPADSLHRRYGVASQGGDQVVWQVLVKQYAHV